MNIRIGIVTDQFANLTRGGAEVQVDMTVKYLNQLEGIEAAYIDRNTSNIDDYDIVHFFKSMYEFNDLGEWIKIKNIPYVVSTIYYPTKGYLFTEVLYKYVCKYLNKRFVNMFSLARRYNLWKNSKYLFPNTDDEALFFEKIGFKDKIEIIPNGIDKEEMLDVSETIFFDKFPFLKNKKFVLNVARIEERKNQLNLLKVCQKMNVPLVIIGKIWDEEIFKQMKDLKYDDFYYLGPIYDRELLFSAYKACSVFALPSSVETPGIVALEAAYYNKPIVITNNGGTAYYFKNKVEYVQYGNNEELKTALEKSMKKTETNYTELIQEYYWHNIVKKYKEKYCEILTEKNRV